MLRVRAFAVLLSLVAGGLPAVADEPAGGDGFVPLFNGRDLSNWTPMNVKPDTFTVRDGVIHSTGEPTGIMRTDRMYENFVLEIDWRHLKPGGNAGLFVWSDGVIAEPTPFARSIEIQILDGHETPDYTSQGDVFAIHGATMTPDRPHPKGWMRCLPSEARTKPSPEWNRYRVECNDGRVTLAVNGKVVSGGHDAKPRKGYICLESEGGEVEYKNLRIKELPTTNPAPDEIATPAPEADKKAEPAAEPAPHTADALATVKSRVADGEALLIDVREPSEWNAGHLEAATLLPLSELGKRLRDPKYVAELQERLPKGKPIYLHCKAGGRCVLAAQALRSELGEGYDLRALKAGYDDLRQAGFEPAEPAAMK